VAHGKEEGGDATQIAFSGVSRQKDIVLVKEQIGIIAGRL
jgi:hypothetical protein